MLSFVRRHTLAYTPDNGRIYAFGLGSTGQLGLGTTDNRTSPFPIKGCFVSAQQPDSDLMETDADATSSSSSQYVVKRIYSGGDHCFVISSSSDVSAQIFILVKSSVHQLMNGFVK